MADFSSAGEPKRMHHGVRVFYYIACPILAPAAGILPLRGQGEGAVVLATMILLGLGFALGGGSLLEALTGRRHVAVQGAVGCLTCLSVATALLMLPAAEFRNAGIHGSPSQKDKASLYSPVSMSREEDFRG